jgi:DNA-binding transcriptional MerR regulator
MSLDIVCIGDKMMKVVQVGNSRYYVQDEEDLISLVHQLAKEGYSIFQIAEILGISSRKVKRYMEDCW